MKNIQKLIIFLIPLAVILIIFLTIYATGQQILRQSANDPQIQLAENGANKLASGIAPQVVITQETVDLENSLSPFIIIFDDQGNPLASSATLEGVTPIPPQGVFDYVRKFGEERITWEPKTNVREATVIKHFDGVTPGFIVVGRSLREVEARESYLSLASLIALAGSVVLTLLGTLLHYQIKKS